MWDTCALSRACGGVDEGARARSGARLSGECGGECKGARGYSDASAEARAWASTRTCDLHSARRNARRQVHHAPGFTHLSTTRQSSCAHDRAQLQQLAHRVLPLHAAGWCASVCARRMCWMSGRGWSRGTAKCATSGRACRGVRVHCVCVGTCWKLSYMGICVWYCALFIGAWPYCAYTCARASDGIGRACASSSAAEREPARASRRGHAVHLTAESKGVAAIHARDTRLAAGRGAARALGRQGNVWRELVRVRGTRHGKEPAACTGLSLP